MSSILKKRPPATAPADQTTDRVDAPSAPANKKSKDDDMGVMQPPPQAQLQAPQQNGPNQNREDDEEDEKDDGAQAASNGNKRIWMQPCQPHSTRVGTEYQADI